MLYSVKWWKQQHVGAVAVYLLVDGRRKLGYIAITLDGLSKLDEFISKKCHHPWRDGPRLFRYRTRKVRVPLTRIAQISCKRLKPRQKTIYQTNKQTNPSLRFSVQLLINCYYKKHKEILSISSNVSLPTLSTELPRNSEQRSRSPTLLFGSLMINSWPRNKWCTLEWWCSQTLILGSATIDMEVSGLTC